MKISTQPYKGSRDFYPEDKQFQQWMFGKWSRVAEKYGYLAYDAPILEPTDIYLMKGSEEIIKEQTYTFEDRGGRSVTMRTEMTPSVSRMVAGRRQELSYPARWYSIPNCWRYERMQRGRLREFWQLNVDIFGVAGYQAELEIIQIVDDIFQAFRAKRSSYEIKISSRVLINQLLSNFNLDADKILQVIRLIDKIDKMAPIDFAVKLDFITLDKDVSLKIINLLKIKSLEELPQELAETESYKNLKSVLDESIALGIRNIVFDITLMRGFDYYTDIVFEVTDTDPENNRSMFGGGRYDGLVGQFGAEPIPTVGFGMGDVTFANFLESNKLIPKLKSTVDATVLIVDGAIGEAQKVSRELREMGVNTSVDFSGKKLDKQMKNADKSGVGFVVFVGNVDMKDGIYTIKDLKNGGEQQHSLARIASIVKDSRR